MKKLITLLFVVLIIAGCEQPQTTPKEEPQEVAQEETVVEPVNNPLADESDYRDEVAAASTNLSNYMRDFSELNIQASENPLIIYTQDWIGEIAVAIVGINNSIADYRAIVPPEHMQAAHDELLKAMDEYELSTDKYVTAIDNEDWALLDESTAHIEKGLEYIERAGVLLNE